MSKKALVIGLGEVGTPLLNLLRRAYGADQVDGYDFGDGGVLPQGFYDVLNICYPWNSDFIKNTIAYIIQHVPKLTIIHSTVPVGTTSKIRRDSICHSPVLGDHTNMQDSLLKFIKWVGGPAAEQCAEFLDGAGMTCRAVETAEETELLKLFCLAKYGLAVAISKLELEAFERYGLDPAHIEAWDYNHNAGLIGVGRGLLGRPIIIPQKGPIGGHCVSSGVKLLADAFPHPLLSGILVFSGEKTTAKVWQPSNVYESAKLGKDVSVGMFSEIGKGVEIGDRTRIGAHSFIPEGFTVGNDVFIGPFFCGTNDRYPPSSRENWLKTRIEDGARIGASVTVLPGIVIGKGSLIGAGSVVTHDVPEGEKWCGVPARRMESKEITHVESNQISAV